MRGLRGAILRVLKVLPALAPANLLHVLRGGDTESLRHEREFLQKHAVGPDEWALIFPFGMGDQYIASSLAAAVRERHGGSGVTVFVRPQYTYIASLFSGVTRVVPVPDSDLARLHQHRVFRKGRLLTVFPMHPFRAVIGCMGVSFLDYYRVFFALPLETRPETPRPQTAAELDGARRLLARHGLPEGNTVILAPRAVSTPEVPAAFWKELAEGLAARGQAVATNLSGGKEAAIPGTTALHVPIEQLIAVAQVAGLVVSARSGVCDLLAHAQCRLTVVYPDQALSPHPRLTRGFSLVASGWRPDAREVWYDAGAPARAVAEALSA